MTAMIFLKLWKNAGEEILKKLILAIPIAHAVGRIGCFLAGCCYGTHGIPVQLIESFLLLVLFWWMRKKFQKHSLKKISFFYLFSYSIIRLGLDFFRGDMLNILWELKETQLIAIVIIICSLMFKLFIENKKYVSS
jgi:phosphatidylglycerol:prolipoprotein diacylglycerol transferase